MSNALNEFVKEKFFQREKMLTRSISGQRRHELLFESYNVSPTEYRVLAFLLYSPNGTEPSIIADTLCVRRQTMTKVLDSLEKKKLVFRSLHPSDRRRVYVQLLPAGETLAEELLTVETDYNEKVATHFTAEEMETYRYLFMKMQDVRDEELAVILENRNTKEAKLP